MIRMEYWSFLIVSRFWVHSSGTTLIKLHFIKWKCILETSLPKLFSRQIKYENNCFAFYLQKKTLIICFQLNDIDPAGRIHPLE